VKHEKIITRADGTQVRIVVTGMSSPPNFVVHRQVDVFTQKKDGINWRLCAGNPDRQRKSSKFSVADYLKNGRHPMFYVVAPSEILLAQKEFGKKYN